MTRKIFWKKSINQLLETSEGDKGLKRVLGTSGLLLMGVGAIIGAGIFILTGIASALYAGPGIILSFVIAGVACLFTALCYAEFASMIPVAGSAYTYSYVTLGELFAWIIGWDLILEYLVIVAAVAVGWSGYIVNIFTSLGLNLPPQLINPPGIDGGIINIPAVLIIAGITWLLIRGAKQSSQVNTIIVIIKLAVILLFITIGVNYIHPANYHPFLPYGWSGVFKGAAIIFFAYIGFDAITTAAEEVKNPKKTFPIAILGSLIISSILYIVVSGVLNGIFPYYTYKETAAPVAYALANLGIQWANIVISIGALCGITSVLLVSFFGQSRVFFAMSRDGLLPEFFARLHKDFRTPTNGIIVVGIVGSFIAAFLPITELAQLVNIGTLAAFIIVSAAIIILRIQKPDIKRPFKTPLVPLVPILAIVFCSFLVIELPTITHIRFIVWLAIGLVIYYFYGRRNSLLTGKGN
ncbi:MAG: amino acid permease [Methanobacterium sp.]|uniref:amino acid permease n=1 Tax=Methanobacterium sp. TaxID=2164 RepID=UPI003C75A45E